MSYKKSITATFRIRYGKAEADETLALLGSDRSLGRWNLQEPVYCQKVGSDMWEATIKLTPGSTVYWSCIILDIRGLFTRRETRPRRRVLKIDEESSDLEIIAGWNEAMKISKVQDVDALSNASHRSNPQELIEVPATRVSVNLRKRNKRLKGKKATAMSALKEVTEDTYILATFVMRCRLGPGEDTMAIIGSSRSFGEWKINNATCAQYLGNEHWEAVVKLPAGGTVYWSCVTLDRQGKRVRREVIPKCRKLAIARRSPNLLVQGVWNEALVETTADPKSASSLTVVCSTITHAIRMLKGRRRCSTQKQMKKNGDMEACKERREVTCPESGVDGTMATGRHVEEPVVMEKTDEMKQEKKQEEYVGRHDDRCKKAWRRDLLGKIGRAVATGIFNFANHTKQFDFM